MPGLLIAAGSNPETLANVTWAIRKHLEDSLIIDRILILVVQNRSTGTPQSNTVVGVDQLLEVVKEACGHPALEFRYARVSGDLQTAVPRKLIDGANEVGRENVVVDLTTGSKDLSSILYAAASFSRMDHIYYLNVQRDATGQFPLLWKQEAAESLYQVVQLAPLREGNELAAQSFFDLVYYADLLSDINSRSPEQLLYETRLAVGQLQSALSHFFARKQDLLAAMRSIGAAREDIHKLVIATVNSIDQQAQITDPKQLTDWCKRRRKAAESASMANQLDAVPGLIVLDSTLETLRQWRNAAAHKRPPTFDVLSVRVALVTAIHLLDTVMRIAK